MTATVVEQLTTLPPEIERAYSRYVESHHGDLSDTRNFAQTMFNAGGRHAVGAMVSFGDLLPQARRIEERVSIVLELLEGFA